MNFSYKNILFFILLSLTVLRCIEPFDPPRDDFKSVLVIEGLITNAPEPQTIVISRSFPIDTLVHLPVDGADVSITDDAGNTYALTGVGNGQYVTKWPEFQGVAGKTYQLIVVAPGEELIQSDPVVMKKVPKIDSISWERTTRLENDGSETEGVQIYVSTHDPQNETGNYRWQYEETWEFNTPYPSFYKWTPSGDITLRDENISKCWADEISDKILISSTSKLASDVVSLFPITFVSATESNRLSIRYSILVRQFALTDDALFFWKQLKKMNQEMGGLFSPQPTAVEGNLHNITNPDKQVVGYFEASEVDEKRIFINRWELPDMRVYSGYHRCEVDTLLYADIPAYPFKTSTNPVNTVMNEMGFTIGYSISTKECTDCRLYGENKKPDFW